MHTLIDLVISKKQITIIGSRACSNKPLLIKQLESLTKAADNLTSAGFYYGRSFYLTHDRSPYCNTRSECRAGQNFSENYVDIVECFQYLNEPRQVHCIITNTVISAWFVLLNRDVLTSSRARSLIAISK